MLVALACDLGLDSLPTCLEAHKWAWFRRYCTAARVAGALERRTSMPASFVEEVRKKVQEISAEGEEDSCQHENHDLYRIEQDEQLLTWLNRSVFSQSIIESFIHSFVESFIQSIAQTFVHSLGQ